jgi:hypothetical protein
MLNSRREKGCFEDIGGHRLAEQIALKLIAQVRRAKAS